MIIWEYLSFDIATATIKMFSLSFDKITYFVN
jgi:hypothetical protein